MQDLAPDLRAGHCIGQGQTDITVVDILHPVVQGDLEHCRIEFQRKRKSCGEAEDRPLKTGIAHQSFALHLVPGIVLHRFKRICDPAGRLLILGNSIDMQGGGKDDLGWILQGDDRLKQVPGTAYVHFPSPVRLILAVYSRGRELRNDEGQMNHQIHALYSSSRCPGIFQVSPKNLSLSP